MNKYITLPPSPSYFRPVQSRRRSFLTHRHNFRLIAAAVLLVFALAPAQLHAQSGNTATGAGALDENTTGDGNTADGYHALGTNSSGSSNTAVGRTALFRNTSGNYNTALGRDALRDNTEGEDNTATGSFALYRNTIGDYNTACGHQALLKNTTGRINTAAGAFSLSENTDGDKNTGIGYLALPNNTTGSSNIAIGYFAGSNLTTGDNNIAIGAEGVLGDANTIRLGEPDTQNRTFVAGIHGSTVPNGVQVVVNPNGRLGTIVSSERFKEAVEPMDDASEALLALRPVTFRYKDELDPDRIPQFGLIAEEVEKINPDLVARDAEGNVNTVRYEAVNAMLLNEFLKEHRKVEQLETAVARQQEQIEQLTAGLQKVSKQRGRREPGPRVASRKR